ncbi:DUF1552 domain-containing protein [Exilibacterium tricleocarpae]|uniref:DUF1552 domain-containing protein n=1 Tax=Exilibacterium tricleocarpae TaxID=2591008 RepID=A0A545TNM5_9GAMM|nr:DUF1552 domain-containing protein [Exilibacterium tricleocarpae]TQV78830.1 DUF1552 domain-containing protein [Exilibacterium tricleocarpae]
MKTGDSDQINRKRRGLLKTFLASGISKSLISSSPLVAGMLFARHAEAQSTPNKSMVIYVPGGGIHDFWAPSGSGSSMTLPSMSASYEPVKTECNFLRNMSHTDGGHGRMPLILSTGYQGDTYDVFMGRQLGADMPFTYVNLGVHSNGQGILTREGNTRVPFQDNPFNAFNLLFGSGTGGGGNPKTQIMEAHTLAANAIKTKLANYEVHRLNEHLEAIAETKRRLDELGGGGGGSCGAITDPGSFPLTYENFSRQARLQADILVAALKCNITRSCSLAFGNHQGEFRIPELNYTGNYHQSIHGGSDGQPNYPYYVEMRAHLGSLSAYVIEKLRTEGLLDTTVVVETTDMGHADLHGQNDVPLMIAGGGSAIRRGTSTAGSGYNQRDMLHTAARACGVTLGYGRTIPGVLT